MTARVCENLMSKSKQVGYGLSFEDVAYDDTEPQPVPPGE